VPCEWAREWAHGTIRSDKTSVTKLPFEKGNRRLNESIEHLPARLIRREIPFQFFRMALGAHRECRWIGGLSIRSYTAGGGIWGFILHSPTQNKPKNTRKKINFTGIPGNQRPQTVAAPHLVAVQSRATVFGPLNPWPFRPFSSILGHCFDNGEMRRKLKRHFHHRAGFPFGGGRVFPCSELTVRSTVRPDQARSQQWCVRRAA